jgi:hypothetical protein
MAGKTSDDLRILAGRLKAGSGGRGRRSPVYQWLFKRADAFQRLLDQTQPSWKSVADALAELDVRDGTGKHPTAECARQSWDAVKKAKRAKSSSRPPPAVLPSAPSVMPPPQMPSADDDVAFEFRTLSRPPKRG